MRINYSDTDDIVVIHLSDAPVVKEILQAWNTHSSYAQDGSVAVAFEHASKLAPAEALAA
jgi:hypothetical protein